MQGKFCADACACVGGIPQGEGGGAAFEMAGGGCGAGGGGGAAFVGNAFLQGV